MTRSIFSQKGKLFLYPLLIVLAGTIVTVSLARAIREQEIQLYEHEFVQQANAVANTVQDGVDRNIEIVRATSAFLSHSHVITRQEFSKYVEVLLPQHGDIQALEWIPWVVNERRAEYEAKARREGYPSFVFTDRKSQGEMVPAAIRAEYFPVYFVEPRKGNEAAFGFDLASNAVRLQAIEASRKSGKLVATSRIKLVQETGAQNGFLLFQPVYLNTTSTNQNHGKEEFAGFALGVFRIGDMTDYALRNIQTNFASFFLSDMSAPQEERPLYSHINNPNGAAGLYQADIPLQVPGRQWMIHLESTRSFEASHHPVLSTVVLVAGLLLTAMLTFLFRSLESRNRAQQIHVAELNESNRQLEQEIAERQRIESELAESELRFRTLFESSPDGMFVIGLDGNILMSNPSALSLFGYERMEEVLGKEAISFADPEDRQRAIEDMQTVARGIAVMSEYNFLRKDGSRISVEIKGAMLGGPTDKLQGIIGIIHDISARKRMENDLRENEEKLRAMSTSTKDALIMLDNDGNISFWNSAAERIFGYLASDVMGKELHPFLIPSRYLEGYKSHFPHFRDTGEGMAVGKTLELYALHKDGHEFPIDLSVSAIKLKGKWHAVGIARDITERKHADETLRKSEEMNKQLFESSRDALMTLAPPSWKFTRANRATAELFGTANEVEFTTLGPWDVSPEHQPDGRLSSEKMKEMIAIAMREGSHSFEWEHKRLEGESFAADILLTRIGTGADAFLQATVRDITERKSYEKAISQLNADLESKVMQRTIELEKARQEAEDANKAKSDFLASMSHEIRTPMNGVIGMIEILQQSSLSETQKEMADIIHDSAFSLLAIINDILDFSKIEAGKLVIESIPMSIEKTVEDACRILDRMANRNGVELMMFTDPAIPPQVLGDQVRLRQIIVNLVNNAIKFSSGQSHQGKVSVRALLAERTPDRIMLEVHIVDNGIGVDASTLARLFAPFTQADSSTTRTYGGTGLGLAICRRLASLMDGNISAHSKPGEGSIFSVQIPFLLFSGASAEKTPSMVTGLTCLIVGSGGLVEDMGVYLTHDEAIVNSKEDLAEVKKWAASQPAGMCIIISDGTTGPTLDELRSASNTNRDLDSRFVIVRRGFRRQCRRENKDMVVLDAEIMSRHAFLSAVAMAAGRIEEPDVTEAAHIPGTTVKSPSRAEALQQGRLILVAEDNEINQKVVLQQLKMLGQTADVADNGRRALELWKNGGYALLLADLHMPEMDGYELTAAIRKVEAGKAHTPIIAFTANALKGEAEHCFAIGMDDYLSKPVKLAQLKEKLEKWLPGVVIAQSSKPSGAPAPTKVLEPVDVNVLKTFVGDDEATLQHFLKKFHQSVIQATTDIHAAFAASEATHVGDLAHKLKSSSKSVGALTLSGLCAEMEKAGKNNDMKALMALVPQFNQEMENVIRFLEKY